jgi:polysaccharide export outer membrane protein
MPANLFRPFHAALCCVLAIALSLMPSPEAIALTAPATPNPQALAQQLSAQPVQLRNYVLAYGDSLNVAVIGNEQLKVEQQPVRPDGKISLPLLGEIRAGGLTVTQLTDQVTKAYTKFFVDPKIVVSVAKFRPLQIAVLGKVNKPGTFPVVEPTRLLPALALAGGLDDRANPNDVLVLRANGDRQTISLNDLLSGHTEENVMLFDGDSVTVAEVLGPDWYRILPPIASSLSILSTIIILLVNTTRK